MKFQLLEELELDATPRVTDLDKQFRSLIKKYHPDTNQSNIEWANRKSNSIISAYRQLKTLLKNDPTKIQYNNLFHSYSTQQSPATFQKQTKNISFQIIQNDIKFAFPVKSLQKIIPSTELNTFPYQIKNLKIIHTSNEIIDQHENKQFNLTDYPFLLAIHPAKLGLAYALNKNMQFIEVINFDLLTTIIQPAHKQNNIILYHLGERYFCPADLAFYEFVNNAKA